MFLLAPLAIPGALYGWFAWSSSDDEEGWPWWLTALAVLFVLFWSAVAGIYILTKVGWVDSILEAGGDFAKTIAGFISGIVESVTGIFGFGR